MPDWSEGLSEAPRRATNGAVITLCPSCPTDSSAVAHISLTHRTQSRTHSVYSSLRLSSLSSAGVRTTEGSKAQLCLTGPTQSYQRVAELEGRPKTNRAVQVLQPAINALTQRIQKVHDWHHCREVFLSHKTLHRAEIWGKKRVANFTGSVLFWASETTLSKEHLNFWCTTTAVSTEGGREEVEVWKQSAEAFFFVFYLAGIKKNVFSLNYYCIFKGKRRVIMLMSVYVWLRVKLLDNHWVRS